MNTEDLQGRIREQGKGKSTEYSGVNKQAKEIRGKARETHSRVDAEPRGHEAFDFWYRGTFL